jgi:hypothetical protein
LRLVEDLILPDDLQKLSGVVPESGDCERRAARLCRGFQALRRSGGMQTPLGKIVRPQVLQNVVDGILKARARFVRNSYALRNQSADFKAIHSLRKRAVNLIRTHDELRQTG